jgi:hypothetical protein
MMLRAGRTSTLRKQLVHTAAQNYPSSIRKLAFPAARVVAKSGDSKYRAQQINRLIRAQLIDQRKRSCFSAIKSAVAFFKIDFSVSWRLIRASSS